MILNIKKVCLVCFQKTKNMQKMGCSRNDFLFFLCSLTKSAAEFTLLTYFTAQCKPNKAAEVFSRFFSAIVNRNKINKI